MNKQEKEQLNQRIELAGIELSKAMIALGKSAERAAVVFRECVMLMNNMEVNYDWKKGRRTKDQT